MLQLRNVVFISNAMVFLFRNNLVMTESVMV